MSDLLFLYKDRDSDDCDCVKYTKIYPNKHIEIYTLHHNLKFKRIDFEYDNATTLLTRKDFDTIFFFNSEILNLTSCEPDDIDSCKKLIHLQEMIKPVYDKLLSTGNKHLFEKVVEEEMEYLQDEFSLSDADMVEILQKYYRDYKDRSMITNVYNNLIECGYEYAYSCGYFEEHTERYFDFNKLGYDLLQTDEFLELSSGRIVKYSY